MELVSRRTLGDLVASSGMVVDDSFYLVLPPVEAIVAVPDKGITQRHLKPVNIKVTCDDQEKVRNFGLVKLWRVNGDID